MTLSRRPQGTKRDNAQSPRPLSSDYMQAGGPDVEHTTDSWPHINERTRYQAHKNATYKTDTSLLDITDFIRREVFYRRLHRVATQYAQHEPTQFCKSLSSLTAVAKTHELCGKV